MMLPPVSMSAAYGMKTNAVKPAGQTQSAAKSAMVKPDQADRNQKKAGRFDSVECKTCESRKYQDASDDAGVSFKSATNINPKAVASAVAGHEMEHVSREGDRAEQEGREVVSQDVKLQTSICPECNKVYVAGGTTTTVTKSKSAPSGLDGPAMMGLGSMLDLLA